MWVLDIGHSSGHLGNIGVNCNLSFAYLLVNIYIDKTYWPETDFRVAHAMDVHVPILCPLILVQYCSGLLATVSVS